MVKVPLPASLSLKFWEYWSPQPLRCNVFRKISLHWLRMCWGCCRGQSQTWINLSMGNIAGSFQPHKYGNPVDCKGAVFFNPWRKKKGALKKFGILGGGGLKCLIFFGVAMKKILLNFRGAGKKVGIPKTRSTPSLGLKKDRPLKDYIKVPYKKKKLYWRSKLDYWSKRGIVMESGESTSPFPEKRKFSWNYT